MTNAIHVDRCLCHMVTFAELKSIAAEFGVTDAGELQKRIVFGTGCGLCMPYVSVMLRTGQTVFDELIPGPDEAPDH